MDENSQGQFLQGHVQVDLAPKVDHLRIGHDETGDVVVVGIFVERQHGCHCARSQSRLPVLVDRWNRSGQLAALLALLAVHIIVDLIDKAHDLV